MLAWDIADEIAEAPREEIEEEWPAEECYPVWLDTWPELQIFLNLSSQWYVVAAPDGELVRTGIRRDAIEFEQRNAPKMLRRRWPEVIRHLRQMEREALNVMYKLRAERREKREQEAQAERKKR